MFATGKERSPNNGVKRTGTDLLLPAQNPNRDQVAKPPNPNPLLPQEKALKRDLRLSIGDGTAYGVMIGVGETYLQAFVLEIGKGEIFAALIATVPQLIGSLLQLISPTAVRLLGSHKWWVVFCAGFQGLCFFPLILAAWFGSISEPAVLLVASFYWATSLGAGPAWNTWQGTIIPRDIRARFFAKRARLCQLATLAGFLGGGFALKAAQAEGNAVPLFAILFGIAMACRAISTLCLSLQSEPFPIPPKMRFLSLGEQWHRFSRGSSGRLLVFAVGMQVGVYIAGPFFVPYMFKVLGFKYHHYAMLIGASFVAKFISLRYWGKLAHRTGAHRLLWIGSLGLVPLAAAQPVQRRLVGAHAGVAADQLQLADRHVQRGRVGVLQLQKLL